MNHFESFWIISNQLTYLASFRMNVWMRHYVSSSFGDLGRIVNRCLVLSTLATWLLSKQRNKWKHLLLMHLFLPFFFICFSLVLLGKFCAFLNLSRAHMAVCMGTQEILPSSPAWSFYSQSHKRKEFHICNTMLLSIVF